MNIGTLTIDIATNLARLQHEMEDAKRAVNSAAANMDAALGAVKTAFGTLGLATSAAGFALMIEKTVEATAELYKLSQRTGVAVEDLSAMKGAAKLAGVGMEDVAASLQKLSKNMVEAQGGSGKAYETFKALGVAITDSNGKLRTASDVQLAVAKSLQRFQQGAGTVTAQMNLMGKAGANLAPYLAELADKGNLNGKVSEEQARQAYEFEKAQIRLRAAIDGVTRGLALELIPVITKAASLMEPLVKVSLAYGVAMYGIPALATAGSVAITALAATMVEAGAASLGFAAALGQSAGLTAAAITQFGLLRSAGLLAVAAFAGWELGKWLRANFLEAQLAGIAFVEGMLVNWERIKFAGSAMWLALKDIMQTILGAVGEAFAGLVGGVSRGLKMAGFADAAAGLEGFADSLRAVTKPTMDFERELAALNKDADDSIASIRSITGEMADEAIASFKAAGAVKEHKAELKLAGDEAHDAAKKYAELVASVRAKMALDAEEEKAGRKLTEAERFRVETLEKLDNGTVKADAAQRQFVKSLLDTHVANSAANKSFEDQQKWLDESGKENDKAIEQQRQKRDELQATLRAEQQQLDTYGLTRRELQALETARLRDAATQLRAKKQVDDLNPGLQAMNRLYEAQAQALEDIADVQDRRAAKEQAASNSGMAGADRALRQYLDDLEKVGDATERALGSSLQSLEGELTSFFTTGRMNARGFVDTLIAEFMRLAVVRPLMQSLVGAGGGIGGLFSLLKYSGSSTDASAPNYENSFDLLNPKPARDGLDFVPYDNFPAFLHRGERVLTQAENATGRSGNAAPSITVVNHIDSRADLATVDARVREGVVMGLRAYAEQQRADGRA